MDGIARAPFLGVVHETAMSLNKTIHLQIRVKFPEEESDDKSMRWIDLSRFRQWVLDRIKPHDSIKKLTDQNGK